MNGLKYPVSPDAFKKAVDLLVVIGVSLEQKGDWLYISFKGKTRRTKNIYNAVIIGLNMPGET